MPDVMITRAEHADRVARVRSVACPKCGAGPGQRCLTGGQNPMAGRGSLHHGARWDAWYAAQARRDGAA